MAMQVTIPTDLEALVQKHLASGAFTTAEEVVRRVLEILDAEESWTETERQALDAKIDRALDQVAVSKTYGPEEAREKLATMRATHLANLDCLRPSSPFTRPDNRGPTHQSSMPFKAKR